MTKLLGKNLKSKATYIINEFSYDFYRKLVNKYIEIDWREINFQNRVVIQFLEWLFVDIEDISIVDVSTQYKNKNSGIHDTSKYLSQDINAAPPDLIIVQNWNYANKNNKKISYLAAVEIKSPVLDPIYNKEYKNGEYKSHTLKEVSHHLDVIPKVILTDCIRWQFFQRKSGTDSIKIIDLLSINKKESNKSVKENRVLMEQLQLEEDEPEEWKDLCSYMYEFITE